MLRIATSCRRLAAMGALAFPLASTGAPMVDFGIADSDIRAGESFEIEVFADDVPLTDEVIAFGFDLGFDTSWSLKGVVIGPAFDFDDSALFPNTEVAGSMDFLNAGPSGDDILLATLSFIGGTAGVFEFDIVSDVSDGNEGLFTFATLGSDPYDLTSSVQVEINQSEGNIPLPATGALVALGLLSLVRIRQQRSDVRIS